MTIRFILNCLLLLIAILKSTHAHKLEKRFPLRRFGVGFKSINNDSKEAVDQMQHKYDDLKKKIILAKERELVIMRNNIFHQHLLRRVSSSILSDTYSRYLR